MNDFEWAISVSDKIKYKMEKVVLRNKAIIPYTTIDGRYDDLTDRDVCWWTNGFYGGILWQLYHATHNTMYMDCAKEIESILDKNLMNANGLDHDNGFKWLLTAVADYKVTESTLSLNRGILAANHLAGRYNIAGSYIRAWNDWSDSYTGKNAGIAIIDCMMNLPLLYWASKETHDPRYTHIAKSHADTALKYFLRDDGSVNHIVEFNPTTGKYIQSLGGQGVGVGSSWTRGQAWALYGFTLSYIHTHEAKYLDAALKTAHFFISQIPDNYLIPVDFCQPAKCTLEDSTAAAIASCGLLELERFISEDEQPLIHKSAINLLRTLDSSRCNWNEDEDNLLTKCTAAYHDDRHEFSIIYGDYYFIEAIWKLTNQELFIW